jgi:hypothetical protein
LDAAPSDVIQILLSEADDELTLWRLSAQRHFLDAYAEEDAIYDEL